MTEIKENNGIIDDVENIKTPNANFKSGYVTFIGIPNAGKSSLVNKLVKESVSIVTAKPQTTRKRTMGILTDPGNYQIVFVDTPGVIESQQGLNPILRKELDHALEHVDRVVAAIAPWEFEKDAVPWALTVGLEIQKKTPVTFILTQADRKIFEQSFFKMVESKWAHWTKENPQPLLITSCKSGTGVEELKAQIVGSLKNGPQFYDVELFTPQTMREIASETIRKQCFELLHQEIPYGLAVIIQKFEEGKILKIEADILVLRESHKPMVIGKGATLLKEIGTRARAELEKVFEQKIFLKLHVVVKPHWIKDRNFLQELGYAGN